VALFGWSPADNQEIMSLEKLVESFDYRHINKSPAVFDMTKLRWMNGEYVHALKPDKFYELAQPTLKSAIHRDVDLHRVAGMVQSRIELFSDITEMVDFIDEVPEYDASMYVHKKMKTNEENSLALLKEVLPVLEGTDDYSNDALFALLKSFADEHEYKTGYVMWPIRTAVSGKQMTPAGATEIMEILGKEESLNRIRAGIDLLKRDLGR
jgi:glutamyl-tRNA synthetase